MPWMVSPASIVRVRSAPTSALTALMIVLALATPMSLDLLSVYSAFLK